MTEWVTLKNIEDFKRKLGEEKDPEKRRILQELLAKEQMKLQS
jgi:hypothetical protein